MALAQSGKSANRQQKSATKGGVPAPTASSWTRPRRAAWQKLNWDSWPSRTARASEVKDFGKRMVDDHSKANDQLKQLASQKGVSLPTSLDAKDQATKDRLSKLQGAAFDKAYMKDMVMDHKKDVAEFKHESMAAKTPDLKRLGGDRPCRRWRAICRGGERLRQPRAADEQDPAWTTA